MQANKSVSVVSDSLACVLAKWQVQVNIWLNYAYLQVSGPWKTICWTDIAARDDNVPVKIAEATPLMWG